MSQTGCHGGELVLTTVMNMPPGDAAQSDFLRQLAAKGIAALVITTGLMVEAIPAHLREIGDELGLPLIELPYQTRFVDIAKVINERIAEDNLDTISRGAVHPAAAIPTGTGRRRISLSWRICWPVRSGIPSA